MRVLIISQYFWPENFRVNDLASFLNKHNNCKVTVLTGQPNYGEGTLYPEFKKNKKFFSNFEGIEVIRVPIIPRGNNLFFLFLNYLSFILSCSTLGIIKVRQKKFDKIFFFGTSPMISVIPGIIISKIKKIPISIWILDLWPETLFQFRFFNFYPVKKLFKFIIKNILNKMNVIFIQSQAFEEKIKNLLKIKKNNLLTIMVRADLF